MLAQTISGVQIPSDFLSHLEHGDCIAVVGAGLSMPDYPAWPQLYVEVAKQAGVTVGSAPDSLPLKFAALQDKAGMAFWPAVSKVLGDRRLSERVKERYNNLVTINWRGIVTTNMDEQIRAAFARVGRPLDFVLSWADGVDNPWVVSELVEQRDWIFQLHGERFHPEDAILSLTDYALLWGRTRGTAVAEPVGPAFMEALGGKVACFFGYSFSDQQMFGNKRLLNRRSAARSPWYAVFVEELLAPTSPVLTALRIKPITFRNEDGGFYEIDELMRELALMYPAESLRGAHEAVFRRAAKLMVEAQADDAGLLQIFKDVPSIPFASIDLRCQLFPPHLWKYHGDAKLRGKAVFLDDREAARQIRILSADMSAPVPVKTLTDELDEYISSQTVSQEKKDLAQDVKARLGAGQNPYPRLAAPPDERSVEGATVLAVTVAPSTYGLTVLAEKKIDVPSVSAASARMNINSLAVRVAYTYTRRKTKYCVFHQRKAAENATYYKAWDVGAAGYIDPRRHEDLGRLSPWLAAANELQEELNIRLEYLPHRDQYDFFGVVQNGYTGQLDLLGECKGDFWTDWTTHRPGFKVQKIEACELTPEEIAKFVREKHWWVPTAILTVILVLGARYPRPDIEKAFRKYELASSIYLGKEAE